MIRPLDPTDLDCVLQIWLDASLIAHDFIDAAFWQSQVENMRNLYIPASQTFVIERQSRVVGFYSLLDQQMAALFVAPDCQGQGLGKQLVAHARRQRPVLTLAVYKNNSASYQFYLSQGFVVTHEEIDEHSGQAQYSMSSVASAPQ
ncbi:N-acetyltransferase [Pseudomonas gessardii]|uniref:N-acetyltransferase n=1 Tax=Pseudomonas gessardii TaxID=78544 RepID=A0ABS9F680_9PSED|nr:N-acetyltransferase [Pseudomonas gessardii]MCF4980219.1 N-acetyltransferase [Pseudomonas gessardii]MCF4992367.1 N-acetyltransferase [Pseudomonas gessardii]MCF5085582.1 N-acetyltransferase [Pseudomonas gessardii]MCF5094986.1 N-acetyltransferase [Pseudomonas gessardii]MCF5107837.1 N-acetyltransferase [Pseudomonas gessardii]